VVYTEDRPEARHTGWEHEPDIPSFRENENSDNSFTGRFSSWWNINKKAA